MQYDNDAKQLKYRVLKIVAENEFKGTLEENLDQIPYDVIPGPMPEFRCCIYREREIIRERVTAARGLTLPHQTVNALWVCCRLPVRAALSAVSPSPTTASAAWLRNVRLPVPSAPFPLPDGALTSIPTNAVSAAAVQRPAPTTPFPIPCGPVCAPARWMPSSWTRTNRLPLITLSVSAAAPAPRTVPSVPSPIVPILSMSLI